MLIINREISNIYIKIRKTYFINVIYYIFY